MQPERLARRTGCLLESERNQISVSGWLFGPEPFNYRPLAAKNITGCVSEIPAAALFEII
jgi:hypothetical protein